MPEIKLERITLQYTYISPFRLRRVEQAERARYIKEELGGVKPQVPTFTVKCGGGVSPSGKKMPSWEETHDYSAEHIAEYRTERAGLEMRPATLTAQARLAELHGAIAAWDKHTEKVVGMLQAQRIKRWEVGLWHVFGSNMPEGDEWIGELEADGIDTSDIATDERGRLLYWLETMAVVSQDEFNELTAIVDQREDVMREARAVTRAMFQHSMG